MNRREQMSCKEIVELVTEYLEGAMAPAEAARFEAHLATCAGCATYLDQMRKTIEVTGRLAEDSLSGAARAALLDAFRGWKTGQSL